MPGSAVTSTMAPCPARTVSMSSRRVWSSGSRPSRSIPPWCDSRVPIAGPTMDARTGSDLPLAAKGVIGVVSNSVRDRARTISVERIWPGSALDMTRAAVLMASPKTR